MDDNDLTLLFELFENTLRRWGPLLRPAGCLVVTELVWFAAEPAERARAFFASEYHDMCDEAMRIHQVQDAATNCSTRSAFLPQTGMRTTPVSKHH